MWGRLRAVPVSRRDYRRLAGGVSHRNTPQVISPGGAPEGRQNRSPFTHSSIVIPLQDSFADILRPAGAPRPFFRDRWLTPPANFHGPFGTRSFGHHIQSQPPRIPPVVLAWQIRICPAACRACLRIWPSRLEKATGICETGPSCFRFIKRKGLFRLIQS
jgi:hypothetical protein